MSGAAPDPLDRIEELAASGSTIENRKVLALVEVARAARALSEACTPKDPALGPLRAALARLDGKEPA